MKRFVGKILSGKIIFSVVLQFLTLLQFSGCVKDQELSYQPASVVFSEESGAYPGSVELTLSAPRGYVIRYTTDSSVPDQNSPRYSEPLLLSGSGNNWLNRETIDLIRIGEVQKLNESDQLADAWIIRAASFAPDGSMGPVSTRTYFPDRSLKTEFNGVMVISLVTDPENLLDHEQGIMVKGRVYDEWLNTDGSEEILRDQEIWYTIPGNFTQKGKDWERPVSVELFDGTDELSYRQGGGLRLQGRYSRTFIHKSFRISFRKDYEGSSMHFDLFPGDGVDSYKYFVLRNGGNTANSLIFKDGWQQELLAGRSFLTQNSRPAVLYLNGEYWGVYALMDRYSEDYLEEHFGVDDVLIVKENEYDDGNEDAFHLYEELLEYEEKDLSDPVIWKQFQQIMDVRSMAEYYAAEIYMSNHDFLPDSNIELWRTVKSELGNEYADGRWRYMMYDTEFSSGLYNFESTRPEWNTLHDVTSAHPLFASALRSPEFRALFMEALKETGSVIFSPDRVERTLAQWQKNWGVLMDMQYERFGDDRNRWNLDLERIRFFYAKRYDHIIAYAEEMLEGY